MKTLDDDFNAIQKTFLQKTFLSIIIGGFFGFFSFLLVGGIYNTWVFLAKQNEPWFVILAEWHLLAATLPIGALDAIIYWTDWMVFAVILGALASPFFFIAYKTPKNTTRLKWSSPIALLVGIFIVVVACSVFGKQRQLTMAEIDKRYTEFCTVLMKKDYKTAYTYLSPQYQQRLPLNSFIEKMEENDGNTFVRACYSSITLKRDISIFGDTGKVFANGLDFTSPVFNGYSFSLEKLNDQWYISHNPSGPGQIPEE